MDRRTHLNFWFITMALLGLLLVQNLYKQYTQVEPIPYSRFQHLLEQGQVAEIAITENQIFGTLKEKHADGYKDFVTTRVEPELAEILDKYHVVYTGVVQSTWLRDLLSWIVPTAIFVGIWLFVIRRMGSSMGLSLIHI